MNINFPIFFFLLFHICFLSACTIYKSEGRKTFENQAPGQIKTLSFEGCNDTTNAALNPSEQEILWTPKGRPVQVTKWQDEIHVSVLFEENSPHRVCHYSSPNLDTWLSSKDAFLNELDIISAN